MHEWYIFFFQKKKKNVKICSISRTNNVFTLFPLPLFTAWYVTVAANSTLIVWHYGIYFSCNTHCYIPTCAREEVLKLHLVQWSLVTRALEAGDRHFKTLTQDAIKFKHKLKNTHFRRMEAACTMKLRQSCRFQGQH